MLSFFGCPKLYHAQILCLYVILLIICRSERRTASFGLLDDGGSGNVRSGGVGDTLESLVGVASGGVGLVDEGFDGSSSTVDGGAGLSGVITSDGRVGGNLLDSVLADSLGDNVKSRGLGSLGSVEGDGGSRLGSVVEAGGVEGGLGPHVAVELNEVSVVTLGELPDEILRAGHLYRLNNIRD